MQLFYRFAKQQINAEKRERGERERCVGSERGSDGGENQIALELERTGEKVRVRKRGLVRQRYIGECDRKGVIREYIKGE